MEASTCRMLLVLLLASAAVTEAMNYLALPRMGRSGYLAFPRLGRRGYLAFPRMGRRSQSNVDKDGADCCMTGLKTEWVPQEGGTTSTENVCVAESCCDGLREILSQKRNGVFYSMCIPVVPAEEMGKATVTSRNVLQKLNAILRD